MRIFFQDMQTTSQIKQIYVYTQSTRHIDVNLCSKASIDMQYYYTTSEEPVCPRVELILKIIIILLIIFLGFIKSKPC